mgnify:CR=1 FL=1
MSRIAALVRSANNYNCCSLIRFSISPRAPYYSSYTVRASIADDGHEVTTKRGLAPLSKCSALPITRRGRLQLFNVLDQVRVPMVGEASRELPQDAGPPLHLPQQQSAGVRGDRPPVKPGHHFAWSEGVKGERRLVTLCRRPGRLLCRAQTLFHKRVMPQKTALGYLSGEKCGLAALCHRRHLAQRRSGVLA